jgi:hypothetical protein
MSLPYHISCLHAQCMSLLYHISCLHAQCMSLLYHISCLHAQCMSLPYHISCLHAQCMSLPYHPTPLIWNPNVRRRAHVIPTWCTFSCHVILAPVEGILANVSGSLCHCFVNPRRAVGIVQLFITIKERAGLLLTQTSARRQCLLILTPDGEKLSLTISI